MVTEIRHAGSYSYLEVQEKTKEKFWIAVSVTKEVNVGDMVRFQKELVAENFESKALNKVFAKVMFASNLQFRTQTPSPFITKIVETSPYQTKDTLSIADLLTKRKDLVGKEVYIRAKVVKVSTNIQERHWVHLQDGTGNNGEVGRVVFTTKNDVPHVGDVVLALGKVSIDKDFGSGYVYPIIVEETVFSK
jgi:hypothetical protein